MQTTSGDGFKPDRGHDRRAAGLGSRRVVATSFAISVVVHLVAILLYPSYAERLRPDGPLAPVRVAPEALDGLEILDVLVVDVIADPSEPEEPDEIEAVDTPDPGPVNVRIGDPGAAEIGPRPLTGAERLRPRFRNGTLWAPLDEAITGLSDSQREELILSDRIAEWYDSLAAAEEAERALTDWTFTDDEGKRWGVADGKIYLGDLVLPGTHLFGVPVGRREEYAERMWQWEEIQRQAARAEVIESWKERQAAIRERRDRERAARTDTIRGGR